MYRYVLLFIFMAIFIKCAFFFYGRFNVAKRKVTLSLEGKEYSEFQRYCEEHAMNFSKKIDLLIKDFLKNKKALILFCLVLFFLSLVQAALFEDKTESDFNNGTFYRTFYNPNQGYLQLNLSQGFLSGNFTSRIFNAGGTATWNNISWIQGTKYGIELPNNKNIENVFRGVNMAGNVLLYHFNESSGTLNDNSGDGNIGTLTGAITYNAVGKYEKALDFAGSTGRISFIPNSSFANGSAVTIETWIKWRGESGENFNLQNIVTAGNFRKALRVTEPDHFNGGSQLLSYFTIGGVDIDLYSTKKIPVGVWIHVATTYNGSALAIYINGRLENFTSASGSLVSNNDNVYIGAESGTVSNFDGVIDDVAVYNRSLSSDEILARYERGISSLNLSIRSCNDPSCSGESFSQINTTSPQNLNLSGNTFFQYYFNFSSENESAGPTIYNVSIVYTVANVPPLTSIIYPTSGIILNYNNSIPLNFSASDSDGNLQSCWYNIDNGTNTTIPSCLNTTFSTSSGSHTLYLFANDSYSVVASNSTTFSVDVSNPLVSLIYPQNTSYSLVQSVLNYSASDSNLQSCWYSTNNGQTNVSLTCGQNVTGLSNSQGSNTWRAYANDSAGNTNSSYVTFFVDSVNPLMSFTQGTTVNGSIVGRSWIFVNVSVIEANEANITFLLYNSTSLVNSSTFTNGNRIINWTGLPDGVYYYNVSIFDALNNFNFTETRTITIDRISPLISIVNPQNTNYTNATVLVDITSDGDNVWFYNGTSNESYSSPVYRTFSQGNNNLIAYANDSAGNINFSIVNFNVDSVAPSLIIIRPISGSTFGTNISLALNYSVSDLNLQKCWYNIDNGANTTIPSCLNITFNIIAGLHTLHLFANDSFGNLNSSYSDFNIQIGAPSISLIDPVGSYFDSGKNIDFVYTASDLDLQVCELWGNFNGIFSLNQTNNSVVSGAESHFFLNLSDNAYIWNVICNDSIGNVAFASNETFYVDTINPSLTLTQPSGTYTSRLNIPISYSTSDASPLTCYYNVYRGVTLEISNTPVNCAAGTSSFSVTLDADFNLNFYAEDPVNHITHSNSNFTVNTVAPPSGGDSGSGGGGGGSSGGGITPLRSELSISKINDINVNNVGIKKILSLKAKNLGTSYLNDCTFKSKGEFASWTTKTETKGLAAGEEYEFIFDVNIPEGASSKTYKMEVGVICKEKNASTSFNIEIIEKALNFALVGVERSDKDKVKVDYSLEELSGKDQNVEIQFLLYDKDGKKITEINETRFIEAVSKDNFETFITIPKDLQGELGLLVNLNSERYSGFVQERVILGSPISGLTILDRFGGGDNFFSILIVILFLAFTFFVVRRIRNHKNVAKHHTKKMIESYVKKRKN
jgi:hypothetical protein